MASWQYCCSAQQHKCQRVHSYGWPGHAWYTRLRCVADHGYLIIKTGWKYPPKCRPFRPAPDVSFHPVKIWNIGRMKWHVYGRTESLPDEMAVYHRNWEAICADLHLPFMWKVYLFWLSTTNFSSLSHKLKVACHDTNTPDSKYFLLSQTTIKTDWDLCLLAVSAQVVGICFLIMHNKIQHCLSQTDGFLSGFRHFYKLL